MPYTHVRCIGLGTNTGVRNARFRYVTGTHQHYLASGDYVGLADATQDIIKRCELVEAAIEQAHAHVDPTDNHNQLKVFMTPEFFFRGANGAYTFDEREEVIRRLYNIAAHPDHSHWLFVFGSILSWSAPARKRGFTERGAAWLLDQYKTKEVYNTVLTVPGGWGENRGLRTAAWRRIAGSKLSPGYTEEDFIAEMGSDVGWVVTKRLRSSIDFVWFDDFINGQGADHLTDIDMTAYRDVVLDHGVMQGWDLAMSDWQVWRDSLGQQQQQQVTLQKQAFNAALRRKHNIITSRAETKIAARAHAWNVQRSYHRYAGTGVLRHDNIDVGVEVCLDHLSQRLANDPERAGGEVALQLIPSAGMSIKDNALVVRNGGLVFNNDGARMEMTHAAYVNACAGVTPAQLKEVRRMRRPCVLERKQARGQSPIEPDRTVDVIYADHAQIFANGAGKLYLFPTQAL